MIFAEVLSQYVMSNMISSAISKARLINESYNLVSAFNEKHFAMKIVTFFSNPRGLGSLKAKLSLIWMKYYFELQQFIFGEIKLLQNH